MGLWASEAYSFHPVSTSRFPSILFHNTPGDVYVLQDARKMRSRLHSDIGRFTASDEGWAKERRRSLEERGQESWTRRTKKTARASNPCAGDRAGICEGVPITFRIGDPPYSTDRTTPITRSLVYIYLLARPRREIRSQSPVGPRSFSRELDALYLPGTERETNYSKIARR